MGWVVNATPRSHYPRERPGTHCTGSLVGPRAGQDKCGKSRPQRPHRPARSQSLHLLSYPGPPIPDVELKIMLREHYRRVYRSFENDHSNKDPN